MNWLSKRLPWLLLLASATLFFLPLGSRALWNTDEGRYAEIAREMLVLKDWISPHLNYVLYFEKPPLMYWLTAASLAVFGQNEFAARFWCAMFGVLTVGIVYILGKRWKGDRAGLLAGVVLATSLGFFCLTQYLVLDMALTFWTTLALYASARILQERPPELVRRFSVLLALAMAGGVLTKGPIAFLFPAVVLGLDDGLHASRCSGAQNGLAAGRRARYDLVSSLVYSGYAQKPIFPGVLFHSRAHYTLFD